MSQKESCPSDLMYLFLAQIAFNSFIHLISTKLQLKLIDRQIYLHESPIGPFATQLFTKLKLRIFSRVEGVYYQSKHTFQFLGISGYFTKISGNILRSPCTFSHQSSSLIHLCSCPDFLFLSILNFQLQGYNSICHCEQTNSYISVLLRL